MSISVLSRSWRTAFLTAPALAAICIAATPARAAVTADFNGDGVLDGVVVSEPPRPVIVVSIAGRTEPQILKVAERPIAVVVADVNHDGTPDLTLLFPNRRLRVWLNYGAQGFSPLHPQVHSKPAKPRRRGPRGSPLLRVLLLSGPGRNQSGPPAGQATPPTPVAPYDPPDADALPTIRDVDLPSAERIPPADRAGRCASRAPPTFAFS